MPRRSNPQPATFWREKSDYFAHFLSKICAFWCFQVIGSTKLASTCLERGWSDAVVDTSQIFVSPLSRNAPRDHGS
jgi:hypothetical protein